MKGLVPPRRRGALPDLERERPQHPLFALCPLLHAQAQPSPPYLGPVGDVPEQDVGTDFGLLSVLL